MPEEIAFPSHGTDCAAWHVEATNRSLETASGRPCVVMAHGFGGTRDSGLLEYAQGFAGAGMDAFIFDYRGFGSSDGEPRQDVAYRRQRQDYHAAIDATRLLRGVDERRIALWGTSYSGGHIVAVAAARTDVVATVSLTPAVDGLAALGSLVRSAGPSQLAWAAAHGLRDAVGTAVGLEPHTVPIVGPPGTRAMMTTPGAAEAFARMAGPTARNEVRARHALEAAFNRPTRYARRVRCPMLIQVGSKDAVAPPGITRLMALNVGPQATVLTYPLDHFDVYDEPWRSRVQTDQINFLTKLLQSNSSLRSES